MALPAAEPGVAGQTGERRPARKGATADVRRAGPDLGPDLGSGLADLSSGGACVRLTAPVLSGDALAVALSRADGRLVARLTAEVRWCRPLGGGLFAVGLEFERPLSPTELAHLVR